MKIRLEREPLKWLRASIDAILFDYWERLKRNFVRKQQELVTNSLYDSEIDICCIFSCHVCCGRAFIQQYQCEEGIVLSVGLKLWAFHLHHIWIDRIDSARCLSRSLRSHACILHLRLSHCDLGSSPEILLIILQSEVKKFDLSNNKLTHLGR